MADTETADMIPATPQHGMSALTDDAERNRLLAEMAEQSTDMISRHTPDEWRFIYASPAVEMLLGYSVDEIIGRSASELYHPDDRDDFERRRPTVVYQQGFYTHTYRFRCKDGAYTWLESTSRSIRDPESGELREILVVSRDVSHRIEADQRMQRYQEELSRAARLVAMGEMASGLAHELNQPLTAITNYVRGIERRIQATPAPTLDELALPLEKIGKTSLRAGEILHRMMDFTRKREPTRSALSLHPVIEDLIEFCAHIAKAHNVTLENCVTRALPQIMADKIQLEQVLLNLLTNAIEASHSNPDEPPRHVWVEASLCSNEEVIISVCDQGVGLGESSVDKLFEQFYTTKPEGLGMGLGISRSLVEAHGGSLSAENQIHGGAAFRIRLPGVISPN
ncbi:ATP-binding protein [Neptunomonas sp. XY-337]|uniref:sensor histidine kinase n=1 Tax=Neptunomonas sp. XY-337 TaxID=2561897 RepID=UPI001F0E4F95|nr:ATP-binding protein [Neptunomonas sp. XY-337]